MTEKQLHLELPPAMTVRQYIEYKLTAYRERQAARQEKRKRRNESRKKREANAIAS
jgi:regulator of protease activity HflC (stomatin/prohibitin superfamily)